jgi:hypothetical protein
MSSGDTLLVLLPSGGVAPDSNGAQLSIKDGGSTPAERLPVVAFDSASSEYFDWFVTIPAHYRGGGLTCEVELQSIATTGGVRIEIALRRRETTDDWDVSHTYDFNGVTLSVPGTSGQSVKGNVTFTAGADMDNVVAGDFVVIRVYRDHDHAGDDAGDDALLERIHIKET